MNMKKGFAMGKKQGWGDIKIFGLEIGDIDRYLTNKNRDEPKRSRN